MCEDDFMSFCGMKRADTFSNHVTFCVKKKTFLFGRPNLSSVSTRSSFNAMQKLVFRERNGYGEKRSLRRHMPAIAKITKQDTTEVTPP